MNRLWVRFLPQMEARVATLEAAAAALAAGTLTGDLKEQASAEAHKLAGVLGTFGLHEGTELAREAESAWRSDLQTDSNSVRNLAGIAEQLRALLAARE
jgi:HPt (histidine-containing phosphotransfer) domain-containing protein